MWQACSWDLCVSGRRPKETQHSFLFFLTETHSHINVSCLYTMLTRWRPYMKHAGRWDKNRWNKLVKTFGIKYGCSWKRCMRGQMQHIYNQRVTAMLCVCGGGGKEKRDIALQAGFPDTHGIMIRAVNHHITPPPRLNKDVKDIFASCQHKCNKQNCHPIPNLNKYRDATKQPLLPNNEQNKPTCFRKQQTSLYI